ncbi:MAG: thermonuclease family protein, partial [Deltaproteobacteria bacterium]|nr:thermonuclease family protein [Deltaproteobacteria bacterium]
DAPETGETCSTEATQRLSSLISGETVYLEKDVSETDIDGRLLRYVYVNGVFVNLELVSCGYCRYTCVAQQKKTTLIIAREWGQTLARECGQTMILD